ncbi:MAG: adenylate/guanylate cyclase domain-containing protein [Pseudomonadota bacterium]
MQRRLAAILAADVVGYTRLMSQDEGRVLSALRRLRAELFEPAVAAHHGRVVKLLGDGALVEFASVVDAVTCAAQVQRRLAEAPEEDRLQLRIGIALGDVVVQDEQGVEDLYGDGVNLASRLEGAADPGGIVVSRAAAEQAEGKVDAGFEPLGALTLKNIDQPVEAFRVRLDGTTSSIPAPARREGPRGRLRWLAAAAAILLLAGVGVGTWRLAMAPDAAFDQEAALVRPTGPTIAVMPFDRLGGGETAMYLAEGLSEDLIVELGRFRDLNILSRQSMDAMGDAPADAVSVGRELGADFVLQGAVRKAGERLRVTTRLDDADTGAQVWSGSYDEALTAADLFDVQQRITERVAAAVGGASGAIIALDAQRARAKPPEKLSSYECTLNYPEFFDRPDLQRRVRGCIMRVVEEEPDYWRGWVQYADALRIDVMLYSGLYPGTHPEKLARAFEAAERGVSLNPDSPRAHFVLAMVRLMRGDREGFFASSERALALGGDRWIEGEIGYFYVWTGRLELGAALLRRAIELNPNASVRDWHRAMGEYHFLKGEHAAALEANRRGREPNYWWAVMEEVAIYAALDGRESDALRARDRMLVLRPDLKIADIVWVYRRFQRPDAHIAKYAQALRRVGLEEGTFPPLDMTDVGTDPAVPLSESGG